MCDCGCKDIKFFKLWYGVVCYLNWIFKYFLKFA